ncbi:hypothetical protein SeMB42_g05077 [Synchytrium endobioticum]|uniref:BHLH domain-containing protein n=1 Tax=Synchytrium endobioticum TaxID=286115 RepID=A0A507CTT1_9FUNG|nr:hypothetical protein SeMB42_g05077 [Synchytrium endobioticum]
MMQDDSNARNGSPDKHLGPFAAEPGGTPRTVSTYHATIERKPDIKRIHLALSASSSSSTVTLTANASPPQPTLLTTRTRSGGGHSKPTAAAGSQSPVGSDEWLARRRENHKEVERRRRDAINDGINELAKLIPEGERNKGRILQRAVHYIQELRVQEASNLEKWTMEKLVCEQAIQELSNQNIVLKQDNDRLREHIQQLTMTLNAAAATSAATIVDRPSFADAVTTADSSTALSTNATRGVLQQGGGMTPSLKRQRETL